METVKVPIKRVRPNETPVPFPAYMTGGSAGMDICADNDLDIRLGPMERALIPTGVAVALPKGFEAQIRPRSGLALKEGLTIVNSPGTIDSDYRGEIKLIVVNLGTAPVTIRRGQRVAQMIVQKVSRVSWVEVSELPGSHRQSGGFGHTDKKA